MFKCINYFLVLLAPPQSISFSGNRIGSQRRECLSRKFVKLEYDFSRDLENTGSMEIGL